MLSESNLTGRATPDGTRTFAERVVNEKGVSPEHFRELDELKVSSIGLGTYLGEADVETDVLYTEAVQEAVALGCNLIDSAINYRFQRSERAIGAALTRLVSKDGTLRSKILVATKVGYVPFNGEPPRSSDAFRSYIETTYWKPGVCRPEEMASNFQHCMSPTYIDYHLDRSLENLGLDCIDVYYLHNPEGQIPEVGAQEFDARIEAAFEALERHVEAGRIARYGVATWNGFRVAPSARDYLSLERLVEIARRIAGDRTHFEVIQLPYNLAMHEAFTYFNQTVGGAQMSTLQACDELGVHAIASASLLQSRLANDLPEIVESTMGFDRASSNALQFVRSTPGITSALVGMSRTAHVRENLTLALSPPTDRKAVLSLFEEA